MRGAVLFVAGLITWLAVTVGVAQAAITGVSMMNHVGINVPNYQRVASSFMRTWRSERSAPERREARRRPQRSWHDDR